MTLNVIFRPKLITFSLNYYCQSETNSCRKHLSEIMNPHFSKLDTKSNEVYILGNFNINFYLNNSYIFQKNNFIQSQSNFSGIKNTMNSVQCLALKI